MTPASRPPLDVRGYLLLAGFILLLQATIIPFASRYGPLSWPFILSFIATSLLLYLYIRYSRRTNPLLNLSIFRLRRFKRPFIIVGIRSLALFGGMFFLPFLLQGYLGYSEIETAMLLLPNALAMIITAPFRGNWLIGGLSGIFPFQASCSCQLLFSCFHR